MPECAKCDKEAIYQVEEVHIQPKNMPDLLVVKVAKPLYACMSHKNDDEIDNSLIDSILRQTGAEKETAEVYWGMIF